MLANPEVEIVTSVELLENGSVVQFNWPDYSSRFHAVWLRDNGQDSNTLNSSNYQKLITLQDIPESVTVESTEIRTDNQVMIRFHPDQWTTCIDLNWLRSHRYDIPASTNSRNLFYDGITTWNADYGEDIYRAEYPDILNNTDALLNWLSAVDRFGVAILSGLADKNAAVLDVIDLFGYVRETNYGEYFEIRTEIDPVNLAYTSVGLQSHTDNPYRHPVPELQLFGCLQNSTEGGESIVVDGFRVAEMIHDENREWFDLLSGFNASFEYKGARDVHLCASQPMIDCAADGKVSAIRFNNRSCTALTDIPFDSMQEYYRAYRRFGNLVNSKEMEIKFKLKPGELFITDNTRVLHGRTGFSGTGKRWMQGAYADKDSLQSKIRVLRQQPN